MEKLITHTYHIGGMSCGGCALTVKNKLSVVQGVSSVFIDLGKKQAEITSAHPMEAAKLQDALSATHYTIAELRA